MRQVQGDSRRFNSHRTRQKISIRRRIGKRRQACLRQDVERRNRIGTAVLARRKPRGAFGLCRLLCSVYRLRYVYRLGGGRRSQGFRGVTADGDFAFRASRDRAEGNRGIDRTPLRGEGGYHVACRRSVALSRIDGDRRSHTRGRHRRSIII